MLLFCRARRALINRPNGIAASASTIHFALRRKRRNEKGPANFAGPFPVLKPVPV
jgi:hypothetical protein